MAIVERFGPKLIAGWTCGDASKGIVISVNDRVVATTAIGRTVNFEGEMREIGFARCVADLWNYLGDGDVLTVSHDGVLLPIAGHGFRYVHQGHGKKTYADLVDQLDKGFIFDRKGKLGPPLSQQPALRSFFRSFGRLNAHFKGKTGYELFPIYGTLLGCIRDGDVIAHDSDLDFAYVSKFQTPSEVKEEYLSICSFLIDKGYMGVVNRSAFKVRQPISLNIYPCWFSSSDEFQPSFGYHGDAAKNYDGFLEFKERKLGRHRVLVPAAAEEILVQIYGSNWRTPDPGFSHDGSKRRFDDRYWPTEEQLKGLFWKQFYKSNQIAAGSTFAEFVAGQLPRDALIIDFGCGTGRDTNYLAAVGYETIGADASAEGVARGNETKAKQGLKNCSFMVANAAISEDVERVLNHSKVVSALKKGRDIVIYLRFFIHAIPLETQEVLLGVISRTLKSFMLAAEFRTEHDEELPKYNAAHYRRFVNGDKFALLLETQYGMTIHHKEEGFGLSVYQGEDPHLCRIIAKRQG